MIPLSLFEASLGRSSLPGKRGRSTYRPLSSMMETTRGRIGGGLAVYETIRRHPGISTTGLASSLGIHFSTAQYHARRLADAGLTTLERRPWGTFHFPAGSVTCPWARAAIPLLADPLVTRTLRVALAAAPSGASGAKLGRSQRAVQRLLARRGIVEGGLSDLRVPPEHARCALSTLAEGVPAKRSSCDR